MNSLICQKEFWSPLCNIVAFHAAGSYGFEASFMLILNLQSVQVISAHNECPPPHPPTMSTWGTQNPPTGFVFISRESNRSETPDLFLQPQFEFTQVFLWGIFSWLGLSGARSIIPLSWQLCCLHDAQKKASNWDKTHKSHMFPLCPKGEKPVTCNFSLNQKSLQINTGAGAPALFNEHPENRSGNSSRQPEVFCTRVKLKGKHKRRDEDLLSVGFSLFQGLFSSHFKDETFLKLNCKNKFFN